jgi:hypothetical protein
MWWGRKPLLEENICEGGKTMAHKWDGTMALSEEELKEFIVYLYEGFKKYGHDKYADHIFYQAVRYITLAIGECKEPKISQKALADKNAERIKEHKKPAIKFFQEFRDKKAKNEYFTKGDAAGWLDDAVIAFITRQEDDELTAKGWRDKNRPDDAYEQLGIELVDM